MARNLEVRMCALELTYKTLKDIILQRTKQQFQLDSSLLERWNPSDTVLRYSPWTSMRLMLNLVAEDNITNLFPNDWQPVSSWSTTQQKHFQVLTEVMTELFLHCGLVNDEWVIEVTNYQDFLKVLLHHLVMGNISTTQVTQFTILMVYMSICRMKHYSDSMEDRHAKMLKSSIWMTLGHHGLQDHIYNDGWYQNHQHLLQEYTSQSKETSICCSNQIHGARLYVP